MKFQLVFVILAVSAVLSLLTPNRTWKKIFTISGVVSASLVGLFLVLPILGSGVPWEVSLSSSIPWLNLAWGVDSLSAFFLVAIFGLSAIIAVSSWSYSASPFFPVLVGSMAAVVMARDGFLFLICWEVMSLSSFFLVTTEHEIREVRTAGWIYLIATHLATAFLMAFFVLLYKETGSFLFVSFQNLGPIPPVLAGTLFIFAVIGFGTKAGIFPFHVWLPHAHPAAPSPVSAIMSGVMIKTGIYGILRMLTFFPNPPLWWGGILIILGMLSAFMGILNGAAERDYKRLLAYSSVENIGIMVTGLGLALIGITLHEPSLTFLGLGGALLHLWNHALFKGALFLAAGQVLHATHSRMMEDLGGLYRKMPFMGTLILILAMALAGLPPLNGFMSEILIYVGLFHGVQYTTGFPLFVIVAALLAMAFAGGLTVLAFGKLFGIIFLGEPRKELKTTPEHFSTTLAACLLLTILCSAMVFYAGKIWPMIQSIVIQIAPASTPLVGDEPQQLLSGLSALFLFFIGAILLAWIVHLLFRDKKPKKVLTWDCAYAAPSPRMQYTSSSFVQPLVVFFSPLLRPFSGFKKITDFFPKEVPFAQEKRDLSEDQIFRPLFKWVEAGLTQIRNLQQGRVQEYLSLIFVALLALLLWEVWFGI